MGAAWWGQHKAGRLQRAHRVPLLCGCVLGEAGGVRVHVCVRVHMCVYGCHTCVYRCHTCEWGCHTRAGAGALLSVAPVSAD